jgi:hypothetical protein
MAPAQPHLFCATPRECHSQPTQQKKREKLVALYDFYISALCWNKSASSDYIFTRYLGVTKIEIDDCLKYFLIVIQRGRNSLY